MPTSRFKGRQPALTREEGRAVLGCALAVVTVGLLVWGPNALGEHRAEAKRTHRRTAVEHSLASKHRVGEIRDLRFAKGFTALGSPLDDLEYLELLIQSGVVAASSVEDVSAQGCAESDSGCIGALLVEPIGETTGVVIRSFASLEEAEEYLRPLPVGGSYG